MEVEYCLFFNVEEFKKSLQDTGGRFGQKLQIEGFFFFFFLCFEEEQSCPNKFIVRRFS